MKLLLRYDRGLLVLKKSYVCFLPGFIVDGIVVLVERVVVVVVEGVVVVVEEGVVVVVVERVVELFLVVERAVVVVGDIVGAVVEIALICMTCPI